MRKIRQYSDFLLVQAVYNNSNVVVCDAYRKSLEVSEPPHLGKWREHM